MPPVETAEFRTTAVMLRPEQIVMVDEVKAVMQRATPERSVSRSDVIRKALEIALPLMAQGAA
jgi:hypothetical protein